MVFTLMVYDSHHDFDDDEATVVMAVSKVIRVVIRTAMRLMLMTGAVTEILVITIRPR